MKYSLYNSLIPISEEKSLLFNAMSDKFMVLDQAHAELLTFSTTYLEHNYGNFYNALIKDRFCIEENYNEEDFAVKLALSNCTDDDSSFEIIINPTMRCNFRCWYCYEQHDGLTKMKVQTIERLKKLIRNVVSKANISDFHLAFFGGEPLLYYNDCVKPLIDYSREVVKEFGKNLSISFTSNGYLLNDRIISHLKEKSEVIAFQITLDGNREQHNKVRFTLSGEGSYDRILDNIKHLLREGIHVNLRINYTSENIQSVNEVLEDMKQIDEEDRKHLSFDFQKVWQEKEKVECSVDTDIVVDKFKAEFGYVSEHYSRVDTFSNPCYGDRLNSLVINYNGDVYKCTARDFIPVNRLGRLMSNGEIRWDKENILIKRIKDKFSNPVCRRCRIFPVCGGACVQTASEINFMGCVRAYSSEDKDNIILARFHNNVVARYEKKN